MSSDFLILAPALLVFIFLVLFKKRNPKSASRGTPQADLLPVEESGPPENAIVVDGSNVMHWGGEPSAQGLSLVLRSLEKAGYAPIVFFDASVGYKLGDRYFDELRMAQLTGIAKEHICIVHKGVVADEMILSFARDHGLRIVTNDQFRDWRVQFPIAAKKGQLLKGTLRDGTVVWRGKL
jgi:hypothetical protein